MPKRSASARHRTPAATTSRRESASALAAEPALPPLAIGIAISVFVHALVLAINFVPDIKPKQKASDQALEVVLVNARSRQKPVDPQALAQANLDGGGNTDQDRRAKTPLPASRRDQTGDQLVETQRRLQELEALQQKLLTEAQSKSALRTAERKLEQPEPVPQPPEPLSGVDIAARAVAMARLEAEIARNVDDYNKRPRKKFVGARTQEYRFAQYIEDWRQKVERIGNLNYPTAARGRLYGNLTLTVEIRANGEIERIDLNRSSGQRVLDDAAIRIVRMAGPYAPFPPDIRRDFEILSITRTWSFTQGDLLESR
ncbi:MAG: TonB family protein [Gammaproteobacteria bacterium]|jgi:periplasmic protein TonB|nr:TonB family protein [Gammaproteobacteria bacterium]MBU0770152.1 TonB family protein [Gammaproteobacteria bacterium]MBU0858264.1 TonB family protein [Gammaproteobacteria bacterium]MBU1847092.1 TonB family protein [Gammaproteobacteria bacterium]